MRFTKKPHTEPIAGYRLLEPIGNGGFGEVWKCEAPGGLLKAIKFVYGNLNSVGAARAPAQEELDAIQRIKAIRHPFLLSMERVECLNGELVIVLELADKNLADRLQECAQAELAGIPREELIAYMTETAEALDLMNLQHHLLHLDIKPHNLFLVCNHVKVGDFGLVHSMSGRSGTSSDALSVTPLYASPETFLGKVSSTSDQYSLAIVYQELLTRTLPHSGKNARQLLMQHATGEPDLRALPEWDRRAVAKALAKDPKARFPSCGHFVRALVSGWIPHQLALVGGLDPVSLPDLQPEIVAASAAEEPEVSSAVVPDAADEADQVSLRTTLPLSTPVPPALLPRSAVLGDYRLQERIRSSPVREVWRALTPDGNTHLVTQIFGWAKRGAAMEEALDQLKALQHPALLEPCVLQCEAGRLIFAADPVERSLRERLQECQTQGLPGIPRSELLRRLGTAATALDELYHLHQVAHLGLTPRHLLLDGDRLRLGEFGLTQLFWLPEGDPNEFLPARYAAPELYAGRDSSSCDQYSLALIWCELLTGTFPYRAVRYRGKSSAQELPDLSAFSESDRAALMRALDPVPEKRWPCSTDLMRSLGAELVPESVHQTARRTSAAARPAPARRSADQPASMQPASYSGQMLRGKFSANLPVEATGQRFEAFRCQWNAEMIRGDDQRFIFHVTMLSSLWQRCPDQRPGLEVEVQLLRSLSVPSAPVEVGVQIRPVGCGLEQGAEFLQKMGNLLFESLQAHLHAVPQRRTEERLPWHHALQLRPILRDGKLGEQIECQGKDISLNGIGFYAPQELPSTQVSLILPQTPQTPRVTTLANVVRLQHCGAGWFEVGAVLLTPAPREDTAEVPEETEAPVG